MGKVLPLAEMPSAIGPHSQSHLRTHRQFLQDFFPPIVPGQYSRRHEMCSVELPLRGGNDTPARTKGKERDVLGAPKEEILKLEEVRIAIRSVQGQRATQKTTRIFTLRRLDQRFRCQIGPSRKLRKLQKVKEEVPASGDDVRAAAVEALQLPLLARTQAPSQTPRQHSQKENECGRSDSTARVTLLIIDD